MFDLDDMSLIVLISTCSVQNMIRMFNWEKRPPTNNSIVPVWHNSRFYLEIKNQSNNRLGIHKWDDNLSIRVPGLLLSRDQHTINGRSRVRQQKWEILDQGNTNFETTDQTKQFKNLGLIIGGQWIPDWDEADRKNDVLVTFSHQNQTLMFTEFVRVLKVVNLAIVDGVRNKSFALSE